MAATVDTKSQADAALPEPAEHSAQADAALSADDLIAQLADTEIEKMIAATEDLKQTVEDAIAPTLEAPVAEVEPQIQPEAPREALLEPTLTTHAIAANPSGPAVESVAASDIEETMPAGAEVVGATETDQANEHRSVLRAETSDLESAAADVARELEADAALAARVAIRVPAPATRTTAGARVSAGALALARAINRPVRGVGDAARELIGSVAIITLVNALAILLYVMLFR
jgi:hypothetical protein